MATARRRQLIAELEVDEGTANMSDEALKCRKRGHKWEERGMTRKHYQSLISQGLMEDALFCDNGCGWTWTITWKLRNGQVLSSVRKPPQDKSSYLMPAGRGRLSRDAARVASAARTLTYA